MASVALTTTTYVRNGGVNITTPGVDTTGASYLLVCETTYNRDISLDTITDSKSNNWHFVQRYTGTNGVDSGMWYAFDSGSSQPLQTGSGHTVTDALSVSVTLVFAAFSGTTTGSDPTDQHNGAGGGNVSTLASGSITPSQASELVVACGGAYTDNSSANNWTFDNSIPTTISVGDVAGTNFGSGLGWIQQGGASSINVTTSDGATAGDTYGMTSLVLSVKAPATSSYNPANMFQVFP